LEPYLPQAIDEQVMSLEEYRRRVEAMKLELSQRMLSR
jgi:hypothetical protein